MSAVAIPAPSSRDRAVFESDNLFFVNGFVNKKESNEIFLPVQLLSLAGKSSFIDLEPSDARNVPALSIVASHVSISHQASLVMEAIHPAKANIRVISSKVMEEPKLSRTEKIQAFLDGATSIMSLGSRKPKELSEAERVERVALRRKNYRRYSEASDQ